MLTTILLIAGAAISGLIVGLKIIAPITKNTIDDKILIYAEDVEQVLEGLGAHGTQGVTIVPAAIDHK